MPIPEGGDEDRKDIGVKPTRPRPGRWIATLSAIVLAGSLGYVALQPKDPPVEATARTTVEETAAAVPEEKPAATPEEIAAMKAEQEAEDMERAVRKQLCLDYGERYVAARTGVQLVKAVQLSQAAGCDWKGMLHADAVTHDFIPEAVESMRAMDASEVTTGGSTAENDSERLDRLDESITELDRKVDALRYRIR
jgi:hypothetical protein